MIAREVPIDQVHVGVHESRFQDDDPTLADLAASITRVGLLEPLIVEEREDGLYVVAGHRRFAACRLAGVMEVPVRVMEGTGADLMEAVFAENYHRKDPSPVEQAVAIRQRIEEGGMSIERVAQIFGRSVDWVRRQMAICEWPRDVLEAVHKRYLSVSAAQWIAKVTDDQYRGYLVDQAVTHGITERGAQAWVQGWRDMAAAEEAVKREPVEAPAGLPPAPPAAVCVMCKGDFRPAELRWVGLCSQCMHMVEAARDQMARGG